MSRDRNTYRVSFLLTREVSVATETEAKQLARSMAANVFKEDSAMKHFDYEGCMVEEKDE